MAIPDTTTLIESPSLSPREIVSELDQHIVGQKDAKRAVAIALRNRWRRRHVKPEDLREEIMPKNILMIGSTGVGKTEIARRLAKLAQAPFVKIEATKFTEVGYVGRDVDSIIRDLMEEAVRMLRDKQRKEVEARAEIAAEERILDALVGVEASKDTREKFRKMLRDNELNDKDIELELQDSSVPHMPMMDFPGGQMGMINLSEMINKAMGGQTRQRKMKVGEAYTVLMAEESDKLIDQDKIVKQALDLTENDGIVFLDELDKIASRNEVRGGEVSREGVQRDLLPLLEGTVISTKYGSVRTDHILFIASGAFHMAKPSDLLPELQGRLPIRVELKSLTEEDLVRILQEPKASLIKQYIALLATEEVTLEFTDGGIKRVAKLAAEVNRNVEDIGARRLHTMMEKLLETVSFAASDTPGEKVVMDENYVEKQLGDITRASDLSKFIL